MELGILAWLGRAAEVAQPFHQDQYVVNYQRLNISQKKKYQEECCFPGNSFSIAVVQLAPHKLTMNVNESVSQGK